MSEELYGLTNDKALSSFMRSFEQKFPDLISKVEDTIMENAKNLNLVSTFNMEGSELSRDEQVRMLILLKMYFIKKGFAISRVEGSGEDTAPYITIEILV